MNGDQINKLWERDERDWEREVIGQQDVERERERERERGEGS